MSIKAMNWAMEQRTGTPSAQCVLYVIADCADEFGARAFPSLDYIAKRSQQSRATVQRRLRDLEGMGALTRSKRFDANGRRTSDAIRLHLDRSIVIQTEDGDAAEAQEEPHEATEDAEIAVSEGLQIDTPPCQPCDGGPSQSCDPIIRPKNPEVSPPTPLRGDLSEIDLSEAKESFERFRRERLPYPIEDEPKTWAIWLRLAPADREIRITAIAEWTAQQKRRSKTATPLAAHRFLGEGTERKPGKWQGYFEAAKAKTTSPAGAPLIHVNSPEGRAIAVLHRIAKIAPPREFRGMIPWAHPVTPQLLALADAPPERVPDHTVENATLRYFTERGLKPPDGIPSHGYRENWGLYVARSAGRGAWREFLEQFGIRLTLTDIRAPWPFPPRVDGTLSATESTGPPDEFLTESDEEFMAGHGI